MDTQNDWNTNKSPGQRPNSADFQKRPDVVDHAQVGDSSNQFEGSGKDMGLIKPPIVSMHPTSQKQEYQKPKEFKIIDDANFKLNHHLPINSHYDFAYPFNDLEAGQGPYS